MKVSRFDYAIAVIGEISYSETQGDDPNLTIPEQSLTTTHSVFKNVKCVVVLISGRSLVIEPYLSDIDALVWHCYLVLKEITCPMFYLVITVLLKNLQEYGSRNVDKLPMIVGILILIPYFIWFWNSTKVLIMKNI